MYSIDDDIYVDIEFHTWTQSNSGGGFSYTRPPAEINSFEYPIDAVYFEKVDFADLNLEQNQDMFYYQLFLKYLNSNSLLPRFLVSFRIQFSLLFMIDFKLFNSDETQQ